MPNFDVDLVAVIAVSTTVKVSAPTYEDALAKAKAEFDPEASVEDGDLSFDGIVEVMAADDAHQCPKCSSVKGQWVNGGKAWKCAKCNNVAPVG